MDTRATAVTTADQIRRQAEVIEVPEGWELLPGGVTRTIRASRRFIDYCRGGAWLVCEGDVSPVNATEVRVLGEVRFVSRVNVEGGYAHLETDGPVLVKRA